MHKLDVEVVAERLCERLSSIEPSLRKRSRELADQIQRAAMSLMLNLGEGEGNTRGNRRLRYETASGSAAELRRAVRFARTWRWLDDATATELDELCDRVMAMLWRMRQRAT